MPKNDSHYGSYNADINHPFSSRLSVEEGNKPKGRPMANISCEMTAMPDFIKRFKPTKVGKQVIHVDGVEVDSVTDLSTGGDRFYTPQERHVIAMANNGNEDAMNSPFF
jgi:hypothetical protein